MSEGTAIYSYDHKAFLHVNVSPDGSFLISKEENSRKILIDVSKMSSDSVTNFLSNTNESADKIYGLCFENAYLNKININTICENLLSNSRYPYLIELNLSNIYFTPELTEMLSKYVNFKLSGFCSLRRLVLIRCRCK